MRRRVGADHRRADRHRLAFGVDDDRLGPEPLGELAHVVIRRAHHVRPVVVRPARPEQRHPLLPQLGIAEVGVEIVADLDDVDVGVQVGEPAGAQRPGAASVDRLLTNTTSRSTRAPPSRSCRSGRDAAGRTDRRSARSRAFDSAFARWDDKQGGVETDARRWISALRGSHERLTAFAAGLDDDGLDTQSICTDWTWPRCWGTSGARRRSDSRLGKPTWRGAYRQAPKTNPPIWDRWNAMPPREAAAVFAVADRRLLEALEGLDADQLDTVRSSLAFLPEPIDVASAVGFRLGEHALHSWDVFATFDAGATLAADATELLIDRLPVMVGMIGRFTPRERPDRGDHDLGRDGDPARRYALELGDAVSSDRLTTPTATTASWRSRPRRSCA